MITYEELCQKAKYFDEIFPGFFANGVEMYRKYSGEMAKKLQKGECDADDIYYDYESMLASYWLALIDRYYPEVLKEITMEDLYLISVLVSINSMHRYSFLEADDARSDIDPAKETFSALIERIGWQEIKFQLVMEAGETKPSIDFENRWKFRKNDEDRLNFAVNTTCCGEPCDLHLINNFLWYGGKRKTRHNINHDYTYKSTGLYQGLIHPDISPDKRKKWTKDFVNLTEYVIRGKYKIDDDIFVMDDLPWGEDDSGNDIDIVKGAACSYQVCVIYFVNYLKIEMRTPF